ncbi:SGNH hydrolase domain-containing protein [Pseudomonas hunanensis]|uniref:SGNH hydrolase domain-containing protein n=1 Tax=Pseudomonas hunanensis TaxID=1247546 RepID=UPI003CC82388
MVNAAGKCLLARQVLEKNHRNVIDLIKYAELSLGAKVINYLITCAIKACKTIVDGIPIYRDNGHLSTLGSVKLYEKIPNILAGQRGSI